MTDAVNIRDKLLATISEIKRKPIDSVDLSARVDSLGMDSLDLVEVLMVIQADFDVYLPMNDELANAETVGELLTILEQMITELKAGKDG